MISLCLLPSGDQQATVPKARVIDAISRLLTGECRDQTRDALWRDVYTGFRLRIGQHGTVEKSQHCAALRWRFEREGANPMHEVVNQADSSTG